MKKKKLKGYEFSNREPKIGDTMICVNKKSVNYGLLSQPVTKLQIDVGSIDTINWKVVESMEERQQELVDEVIESLKEDFKSGDYTVLEELLKFIPMKNLVQSLEKKKWSKYSEIKLDK